MKKSISDLSPWIRTIHQEVIQPKIRIIQNHPFVRAMEAGACEKKHAEHYFSGLMWHLLQFGKHVQFHMKKRPTAVATFLGNRSEDEDGDTEILGRIVAAFGGNPDAIAKFPDQQKVDPIWIQHDALLRAAIYSEDLPWQVGTAALNVGIESLVPTMIEPLFRASVKHYGVTTQQARWLESRSGDEEKQHGENGFLILDQFVDQHDLELQQKCRFWIEALSDSMAYRLLKTGLPESIRSSALI